MGHIGLRCSEGSSLIDADLDHSAVNKHWVEIVALEEAIFQKGCLEQIRDI